MKDNYLGEFEHLLLLTLAQLQGRSYGAAMRSKLKELIDRDTSIGALYATLERLEKKGYVRSETGEPTATRGGRAKRYFELTAEGRRVLKETRDKLNTMWEGVQLCR